MPAKLSMRALADLSVIDLLGRVRDHLEHEIYCARERFYARPCACPEECTPCDCGYDEATNALAEFVYRLDERAGGSTVSRPLGHRCVAGLFEPILDLLTHDSYCRLSRGKRPCDCDYSVAIAALLELGSRLEARQAAVTAGRLAPL